MEVSLQNLLAIFMEQIALDGIERHRRESVGHKLNPFPLESCCQMWSSFTRCKVTVPATMGDPRPLRPDPVGQWRDCTIIGISQHHEVGREAARSGEKLARNCVAMPSQEPSGPRAEYSQP